MKKGIFRLGRGDWKEDLVCPIDPSRENRQRTHVNGAVVCSYEDSPHEVDEVGLSVYVRVAVIYTRKGCC